MELSLLFVTNSVLLGVGLAMDAFSVSLANGLGEPRMSFRRMALIAGTYAFFQALMPMTGWFCVHTIVETFQKVTPFIPWIALALLAYIGLGMIREGLTGSDQEGPRTPLSGRALLLQGVATSIDALSVGFTIAEYHTVAALTCSLIVAGVTFVICLLGLVLGKRFGLHLAGRALILGGAILIAIGLEIFVTGVLR